MRISNQMLLQDALRNLQGNLESLYRAERQAATGRRIQTASDDPADASRIARISAHLRDIDQYRRNSASANIRLSAEDAVLTSVRDLLDQAKKVALGLEEPEVSESAMQGALTALAQIREHLISLGNTRLGNEYLFGGAKTEEPPFLADGTYVGDQTVRRMEIDQGLLLETNHTGDEAIAEAVKAVEDLLDGLEGGGNRDGLASSASEIEGAQRRVLTAQTELGVRLGQLKDVQDHLARRSLDLTDQRDALRDADPAEAILNLMTSQQAMERAYEVVGRVASMNIINYLR